MLDYIASLPGRSGALSTDAQLTALENEIKRYRFENQPVFGYGGRCDRGNAENSMEAMTGLRTGSGSWEAEGRTQSGFENSSGILSGSTIQKYRHLTELDRECIVHLIEKILIYDGKHSRCASI